MQELQQCRNSCLKMMLYFIASALFSVPEEKETADNTFIVQTLISY